ncbi:hypothetical protein LEP1GSC150_0738 [Leptospira interrogans serovar Copenhageni str. LT2050]|uniref:Uncharacterized protein n=1 Tax=Leptospira interrogans serovar Copenhageni str. LT2050 TaxID=1001598 RepID=M3IIP3_LEPIT|nr:hypothetical protein LEP1GSC150_0738 [Leptospira interrogans serovar Copenhageni str. LT2050]
MESRQSAVLLIVDRKEAPMNLEKYFPMFFILKMDNSRQITKVYI